ncbi:MAG TPA: hypothetical protein VI749_03105 [Candidatus Omnitrophota bacterium]|nr:hypothetical protein [Candidatus Omnitrophota bacterium]
MLSTISLLTVFIVAVIYPLCFWISADSPLKNGFHKFHLGLPCVLSGVVVAYILFHDYLPAVQWASSLWFGFFITIAAYYWRKEHPNPIVLTAVSLLGSHAFVLLHNQLIPFHPFKLFTSFLAGAIFCAALFAMNLGHWYLNVHGLPISHLRRAVQVLTALLGIRFLWNFYQLTTGRVIYQGEESLIRQFAVTMDGFLLFVGVIFGGVFPLISVYFATETAKLKNTQATTGILYVILCAVLIADMAYKYYLIKFAVAL